jgi:hypothetical protein
MRAQVEALYGNSTLLDVYKVMFSKDAAAFYVYFKIALIKSNYVINLFSLYLHKSRLQYFEITLDRCIFLYDKFMFLKST